MDRSVDSIGSCSLDVDADSSDISDTSGSLNFPTPLSVKDITREFTTNIRERCSVHTVQQKQNLFTAIVDPASGQVRMVLTHPTSTSSTTATSALPTTTPTTVSEANLDTNPDKKPSYLNLACCVNGYSNLTTYDSKVRQDINKSREVSPIRPSSSSIQYCKKNNSLAPPVLLEMSNISKQPTFGGNGSKASVVVETNSNTKQQQRNNSGSGNCVMFLNDGLELAPTQEERRSISFIQQRVERLYGPGALAQGFYSPKKVRGSNLDREINAKRESENLADTELSRKFQQLSPSKDYSDFRKKIAESPPNSARQQLTATTSAIAVTEHAESQQLAAIDNNVIDLPCLRHLSQEFRAQLPTISPKKNTATFARSTPWQETSIVSIQLQNGTAKIPHTVLKVTAVNDGDVDVVDHKAQAIPAAEVFNCQPTLNAVAFVQTSTSSNQHVPSVLSENRIVDSIEMKQNQLVTTSFDTPPKQSQPQPSEIPMNSFSGGASDSFEKDGNHFLKLLKKEQVRLLALANDAEKYIDALSNNAEITEDTMGFLRAASGKARLLVSQKMKQFEGLCHNNLNRSPEDKFPTTLDDLQGFWDMVNLQVDHIDSIFAEIEILKNNDWKKPKNVDRKSNSTKQTQLQQKSHKTGIPRTKTNYSNGVANINKSAATAVLSAAALKRESQRKKLLEIKRKNRIAMAAGSTIGTSNVESNEVVSSTNAAEIFVSSENNKSS